MSDKCVFENKYKIRQRSNLHVRAEMTVQRVHSMLSICDFSLVYNDTVRQTCLSERRRQTETYKESEGRKQGGEDSVI